MAEQKAAEAKRWNEMDARDRKFNVKGISAFEAGENDTGTLALPGFEIDKTFDKEDFKRKSLNNKININKT